MAHCTLAFERAAPYACPISDAEESMSRMRLQTLSYQLTKWRRDENPFT